MNKNKWDHKLMDCPTHEIPEIECATNKMISQYVLENNAPFRKISSSAQCGRFSLIL